MQKLTAAIFCALGLIASGGEARALVLDWGTAAWTNGNLNGGVELDNALAGTEVTFLITGNTNKLRTDPGTGLDTPAISDTLHGGTGQQALNFTANVGTQTEITVTVSFSPLYLQGIENVSFTLFDIDKTTDSEYIKDIRGIALDGTLVAPTISNTGPTVQRSGTGTGQLLTGIASADNATGNGNATISFGSNVIRGFTFTFDNSSGPPRVQEFAMGDLNFTPVPEVNPAMVAGGVCLAGGWLVRRRKRSAQ